MATRRVKTVIAKELADYIEFYGIEGTLEKVATDKIIDPVIKTAYADVKNSLNNLKELLISEQ